MTTRRYDRLAPTTARHLVQAVVERSLGGEIRHVEQTPSMWTAEFDVPEEHEGKRNVWTGLVTVWLPVAGSHFWNTLDSHQAPWSDPGGYLPLGHQIVILLEGNAANVATAIGSEGAQYVHVWGPTELDAALNAAEDISRRYLAFVADGDMLSIAASYLPRTDLDSAKCLSSYLARELYADQFARLGQAGTPVDDKIPLAQVFVDLPSSGSATPAAQQEAERFVAKLVAASAEKLDSLTQTAVPADQSGKSQATALYVLVGGPGQGKTTVGQFLCQIFRAAILTRLSHFFV